MSYVSQGLSHLQCEADFRCLTSRHLRNIPVGIIDTVPRARDICIDALYSVIRAMQSQTSGGRGPYNTNLNHNMWRGLTCLKVCRICSARQTFDV